MLAHLGVGSGVGAGVGSGVGAGVGLAVGCGGEKQPRHSDQIFQDRLKVDTLFLTEDGQRITRPMNPQSLVVFDAAAGKIAWPAFQCNNPDCPGRNADGSPYLFSRSNPFVSVQADGLISTRSQSTPADFELFQKYAEVKCPACLKKRNRSSESPRQSQQYVDWCQSYVLPSAAKRLAELDRELQKTLPARPRQR